MKILPAVLSLILSVSIASAQSTLGNNKEGNSYGFSSDLPEAKLKIDVYPNPAIENVFIRIESEEPQKIEFELYNIIGASLKIEPEQIEQNYFKIGIKELPAGYYLLMVMDPSQHYNQAFKIHKASK